MRSFAPPAARLARLARFTSSAARPPRSTLATAILLGVGARGLLLFSLGALGRILAQRLGIAEREIETKLLHTRGEMLWQISSYIQLAATGFWQWSDRAYIGRHLLANAPYRLDGVRPSIDRVAPTMGQHDEEVFSLLQSAREDA